MTNARFAGRRGAGRCWGPRRRRRRSRSARSPPPASRRTRAGLPPAPTPSRPSPPVGRTSSLPPAGSRRGARSATGDREPDDVPEDHAPARRRGLSGCQHTMARVRSPRRPSTPSRPASPSRPGDILGVNTDRHRQPGRLHLPGDRARRSGAASPTRPTTETQATFTSSPDSRVNASAEFEPSNAVTFAKTRRNKKKGNATITASLAGPGTVVLSGKGLKRKTAVADGARRRVGRAQGDRQGQGREEAARARQRSRHAEGHLHPHRWDTGDHLGEAEARAALAEAVPGAQVRLGIDEAAVAAELEVEVAADRHGVAGLAHHADRIAGPDAVADRRAVRPRAGASSGRWSAPPCGP